MNVKLVKFLLSLLDKLNEKKIINFFRSKFNKNINVFIDIGAHHGETISLITKNFFVNSIYACEASPINFKVLQDKEFIKKFKIKIYNYAIGLAFGKFNLNQVIESSSSTFVNINEDSKYYLRKKKVLNFFSKAPLSEKVEVEMITLKNFFDLNSISEVDILKIDTEGYDFNVIKSLGDKVSLVKYIHFEHHFHDMLQKNYSLSDIHNYLLSYNFCKVFKIKMFFRKTFEYVYQNRSMI